MSTRKETTNKVKMWITITLFTGIISAFIPQVTGLTVVAGVVAIVHTIVLAGKDITQEIRGGRENENE